MQVTLLEQLSAQVDTLFWPDWTEGYEQHSGIYANKGAARDQGDSFGNVMRQQADHRIGYKPDNVGQILNSWKIRVIGHPDGMTIDNYIYKIDALTHHTLDSVGM